jgi:hypothetical protein
VNHHPKEILTVRDLAVDYAISESSQRLFRRQGRFIPAFSVGRRLMYRRVDLEAWLSARAESPRGGADGANASSLTEHQIARLRDVSADAGLTSEQIDRLIDTLTDEPDQGVPEPAAGGDR